MTTSGDTRVGALEIHRLLDEAFAGIVVTPEVQDLKEEMRGNLVVRAADFESTGLSAAAAAQRAIAELGDIRSVLDEIETASPAAPPWVRERVRPRPAYVVRTVVLAALGAVALAAVLLPILGIGGTWPWGAQLLTVAAVAVAAGVIVADGLRQETTTNHRLPTGRSIGYGLATTLALAGVGAALLRLPELPWLVSGGLAALIAIVVFTALGATQTNRHKTWVVRMQASHQEMGDRFADDPAAAARFGLYTVTIWLIAFAGFAVLSFTSGWAWSWLALLAGVVAMMVTLARTLFAPKAS